MAEGGRVTSQGVVSDAEWRRRKHEGWQAHRMVGGGGKPPARGGWELLEDEDGAPYPEEVQVDARDRVVQELLALRDEIAGVGFRVSADIVQRRIEELR